MCDEEVEDMSEAIANAFIWEHTPEGHNYWENIYDNLMRE